MCKIIVPVLTILNEDESIDYEGNQILIDHLVEGGVDGILVLGSSGEFPSFGFDEKKDYLKFYSNYVDGRVELYAGTNCPKFSDSVELANFALRQGYESVLDTGPYYFGMSEHHVYSYYDRLLSEVDGSVFIYNYPARTGHDIKPATIRTLCERHSNLKGLKDSVDTPGHTREVCRATQDFDFSVYSGFDDQFLLNLQYGGAGCISALSNLVPQIWSSLIQDVKGNDFQKVLKKSKMISDLMFLYDIDVNFIPVFTVLLKSIGLEVSTRSIFPFDEVDQAKIADAAEILNQTIHDFNELNEN